MKLFLILLLSIAMFKLDAIESNELIVQGKSILTFDDLDGYAFTIPSDRKSGFFDSPLRIDATLKTLLTMKHVTNYAKENNLINDAKVSSKVSEYLYINKGKLAELNLSDFDYLKLKNYLQMKYSYKLMESYFRGLVNEKDLEILAEEIYVLNKEGYYQKKLMDLQYINIKYTIKNKDQQLKLAKTIQKDLKLNKLDFSLVHDLYKSNTTVEFIDGITDFYYNKNYKTFSDYIFKSKEEGLLKDILDFESKYIVVVILKISPEGYKEFSQVKPEIIAKLKKEKIIRDFADMVLKLTTDSIVMNKDAIISLRTRY